MKKKLLKRNSIKTENEFVGYESNSSETVILSILLNDNSLKKIIQVNRIKIEESSFSYAFN